MNRALALLAVLLLTLGLAAASGGDDGEETEGTATPSGATPSGATPSGATPSGATPSGATPSGETVKIKFWHAMNAANQEALKRLPDRFNSSQSEGQVELQFQGTYEANLATLLAFLACAH